MPPRLQQAPPSPTPLDPGDPVAQTLAAMQQQGQVPAGVPAETHVPPEAHIQNMMQNLFHNSIGAGDSSMGMRALAALMDVLDAPKHQVQSWLGTDQAEMDRAFATLAKVMPAPRTMDLLNPVQGMGRFGGEMFSALDTDRRWSPETAKIVGNIATDPTSYLGVGLFKSLAKGAAQSAAPKVVQEVLKAAQVGDEAAIAAMGSLADGIIGMIQKGIPGVGNIPGTALSGGIPNLSWANSTFNKWLPQLQKWTDYAKQSSVMNDVLQHLEHNNLDLTTVQHGLQQGTLSMQDIIDYLPRGMQTTIDPAHLEMALTKMPQTTSARNVSRWASTTNPTTDRTVAYENYKTWLRHDMGIDNPAAVQTFYTHFTDWWKQQALASISNIEQNAKSGVLGAMLTTGPGGAARTAADLFDNAGNILRGKPFTTQAAADLSARTGTPIPNSLHEMADRALSAQLGPDTEKTLLGTRVKDVVGGAVLGAGGAEATDQDPVTGALLTGATFGLIPKIGVRLRKSSQGVETVLRERGYVENMGKDLAANVLDLNAEVANLLLKPGPRGGRSPVSNSLLGQLTDMIAQEGGQVHPDQVRQLLLSRVRVTPARAEEAARAVDDALYESSRAGVAGSNEFNFDYQDLSPLERAITIVAPFATWYLKAVPFFTKQGLKHPVVASLVQDTNAASSEMQQERGLPGRFAGTIPHQGQGMIMSMLLGRPQEAFSNPLATLVPFGNAARGASALSYNDEETSPLKIARNYLEAGGLGLNPLITTGARIAGLGYDMNDPSTQNLLRWGAPLAGVTALAAKGVENVTGQNPGWNVNPNSGLQAAETVVRQGIDAATHGGQGRKVQDLTELAAERRVDELALKATGQPIGSGDPAVAPYVRARRDKTGPIWAQAKNEVAQERGAQSALGFVASDLRPDAILNPQEAAVRDVKKDNLIDPALAHALDQAAETSPSVLADPKALQKIKEAVDKIATSTGRPTPQIVADRLAAPTNANLDWVSKEIYKWEVEQEPLQQGYGASGTMEQRRIGNDVAAMGQAGRGLDPLQQQAIIAANRASLAAQGKYPSTIVAAHQIAGQERATIQKQDPLLDEYLTWRKTNPGLDVPDFLKQKFGK